MVEKDHSENESLPPVLFGNPGGGDSRFLPYDLKRMYPVLAEMREFDGLKPMEMKFVWLFANQMSPYVEAGLPPEERALLSAQDSFWYEENRLKKSVTQEEFDRFANQEFRASIRGAIEAMGRFDPRLRYEAQVAIEQAIKNAYAAMDYTPEQIRKMEPEDRKKAMDVIKVSANMLKDLIEQKEKNYSFIGLGKKDKAERNFTGRLDDIMKRRNESQH